MIHSNNPDGVVTVKDHLNSLLTAYQYAEKIYNQCVTDVVTAEIRRDDAAKEKEEAFRRLEDARKKFASTPSIPEASEIPAGSTSSSVNGTAPNKEVPPAERRPSRVKKSMNSPRGSRASLREVLRRSSMSAAGPTAIKLDSDHGSDDKGDAKPPRRSSSVEIPSAFRSSSRGDLPIKSGGVAFRKSDTDAPSSPVTRNNNGNTVNQQSSKTLPVFASPYPPGKPTVFKDSLRASSTGSQKQRSRRYIDSSSDLDQVSEEKNLREICAGRSREWLDEKLDCEQLGLVKRFAHASFGTRTSDKTKKLRVFTLVIKEDSNDLAEKSGDAQDLYVGMSPADQAKPSLRDKATEALMTPPQKEPIAVFHAPSNGSEIYYVGHWIVADGKKLVPPKTVKGFVRQAHIRLEFAGLDPELVKAMNSD